MTRTGVTLASSEALVSAQRSESELRDYLAEHLEIVEPDLTLVKMEYPLANPAGARGFIDIVARDSCDDLVVIELKRSDQTARQALHELEKYVALLAADRGVRVDRLRCILVSTTWHELAVPFARFLQHVDFHVLGLVLKVGNDGLPIAADPAPLPDLAGGLEACPLHLDLLFWNAGSRDEAARSIDGRLGELCVEDYITVHMDYEGGEDWVMFPHSVYLVLAEFSSPIQDFVVSTVPGYEEHALQHTPWGAEQLAQTAVVEVAAADSVEMGSPDRFKSAQGWRIVQVVGHGRYSEPLVWTEAQLLGVVGADGDRYSTGFTRRVRGANAPAWARMSRDLDGCLQGAGDWPAIVSAWLNEREVDSEVNLRVTAYVPNDILGGLERLARTGRSDYLPTLSMVARSTTQTRLVKGDLHWNGTTCVESPDQTLSVVFRDFMSYAFAQASGALREFEERLCTLHGLRYELVETLLGESQDPISHTLLGLRQDHSLKRAPFTADGLKDVQAFASANPEYLRALRATFDAHVMRAD